MEVLVNIKQGKVTNAQQKEAWGEFLDMLQERAEAEINKDAESVGPKLAGSAERSV